MSDTILDTRPAERIGGTGLARVIFVTRLRHAIVDEFERGMATAATANVEAAPYHRK